MISDRRFLLTVSAITQDFQIAFPIRHFPDGLNLEPIQTRNRRHFNNALPLEASAA